MTVRTTEAVSFGWAGSSKSNSWCCVSAGGLYALFAGGLYTHAMFAGGLYIAGVLYIGGSYAGRLNFPSLPFQEEDRSHQKMLPRSHCPHSPSRQGNVLYETMMSK